MGNKGSLVLGGNGTVDISINGGPRRTLDVKGIPDLYTLLASSQYSSGLMKLTFSPGVQAFDFTFGGVACTSEEVQRGERPDAHHDLPHDERPRHRAPVAAVARGVPVVAQHVE